MSKLLSTTPDQKSIITDLEQAQINISYSKKDAKETQRAHGGDCERFFLFCQSRNIDMYSATWETVAVYINALNQDGKKIATIRRYVSGIASCFRESGLPSPTHYPKIKGLLQGIAKEQKESGIRKAKAPALTLSQVDRICEDLRKDGSTKALRDRTILLIGFLGAFRRSELAAITLEQITHTEKGFSITLTEAKNIKDGEMQVKAFFPRVQNCPVEALREWLGAAKINGGPIFRRITKGGQVGDNAISAEAINNLVKKYFGKDFSAHSLRAGFITEAGRRGQIPQAIAKQSGHKKIQMILDYTRHSDAYENNAVAGM